MFIIDSTSKVPFGCIKGHQGSHLILMDKYVRHLFYMTEILYEVKYSHTGNKLYYFSPSGLFNRCFQFRGQQITKHETLPMCKLMQHSMAQSGLFINYAVHSNNHDYNKTT